MSLADRLEAAIDADRVVRRTLDLVAIRSDPGDEGAIAEAYAAMLADAGLDASTDERFPGSPSVIARLPGRGPGPTLQLGGHLDAIPVAQDELGVQGGRLYGRGACDMKGGLAAFAEVSAALQACGGPAAGSLLVTAYGQHEGSPAGTLHEPLRDLLRRGIHGDLVYIADGPHRMLPVAGKGSVIFEVHLRRAGEPEHELLAPGGLPNPVMAAHRFVALLEERSRTWPLQDPDVGGETLFVGAIRGGDLYNRIAVEARIDGTRRYPAPRTFEEVRAELEAVGEAVAGETGVEVTVIAHRSGQPFRQDPGHPFLAAFQEATRVVTGAALPASGILLASDINHVIELTGAPTILHGVDATRAHATPEWVPVPELIRATRVLARTVGTVLGAGPP
jgi:acetylornithine deacetylase/succinyl-diaminopimelate desuccinylase-like protein